MARNCWVGGIEFTDGFLYPIGSGSEAATLRSLYDQGSVRKGQCQVCDVPQAWTRLNLLAPMVG